MNNNLSERQIVALRLSLEDDEVVEIMEKFATIIVMATCMKHQTDYPTNVQIIDTGRETAETWLQKLLTQGLIDDDRNKIARILWLLPPEEQ